MYQINDIVKSIEPKMSTLFGKDKAYKEINEYYEEEGNTNKENKYTNIFNNTFFRLMSKNKVIDIIIPTYIK